MTTGFDNTTDPKADCATDPMDQNLSDEAFKKYYFSNGNSNEGNAGMKKGGDKYRTDISLELIVTHLYVTVETAITDPRTVVDFFFPKVFYTHEQLGTAWSELNVLRRVTGPLLLAQWIYCIFAGGIAHQMKMGFWNNVLLAAAVYLYVDIHSVFLHVSLDNPMINHWPLIGIEAERFQWHHDEPNKVVTDTWLTFLSPVFMILCPAATYWMFFPKEVVLRTFTIYMIPGAFLMMCAHRWSHQVPHRLHPVVKAMQHTGLLISGEEHCLHHATYDRNFAIFSGVTNPFFNALTRITGEKHPIWVFGWALWIMSPGLFMAAHVRVREKYPDGHPVFGVQNNMRRISRILGGEDVPRLTVHIAAKVAGIVGVGWVLLAAYSVYGLSFMTAHAALMGLAVTLAMSEGMLANSVGGVRKNHKNAMRLAGVLLAAGAYAIVNHKWKAAGVRSWEVLVPQSTHAWVGSTALAAAFIQTWSGILRLGGNTFHTVLGKFTYYTCAAATILGADSMLQRGPHYFAIIGLVATTYYVAKARGELPYAVDAYFSGIDPKVVRGVAREQVKKAAVATDTNRKTLKAE
jgi:hypothetical protein